MMIFKSLGRFQNPMDTPDTYSLVETKVLAPLMNAKPVVLLQHLRTPNALPLHMGQDRRIKSRILDDATEQLNKVF